ncbi:hypothetical protein [Streptomyces achromogenes]
MVAGLAGLVAGALVMALVRLGRRTPAPAPAPAPEKAAARG